MFKLKNLGFYYFSIIFPLVVIFASYKLWNYNSGWFVSLFFFYATIYRTLVDGNRLYQKKIIAKKAIWKRLVPLWFSMKYFKELYLK